MKLKIGDIILAKSFCDCKIKVKLTKKDKMGWFGIVYCPKDIKCLKYWSIPIDQGDETFVFDFHIIKKIRKKLDNKKSVGYINNRKSKRRT